jgi:hypothetical protein
MSDQHGAHRKAPDPSSIPKAGAEAEAGARLALRAGSVLDQADHQFSALGVNDIGTGAMSQLGQKT